MPSKLGLYPYHSGPAGTQPGLLYVSDYPSTIQIFPAREVMLETLIQLNIAKNRSDSSPSGNPPILAPYQVFTGKNQTMYWSGMQYSRRFGYL